MPFKEKAWLAQRWEWGRDEVGGLSLSLFPTLLPFPLPLPSPRLPTSPGKRQVLKDILFPRWWKNNSRHVSMYGR